MDRTVSRKRIFTKEKLEELSQMLIEGVPKLKIAQHFGVDHSSIFYQAKKLEGTLSEEVMERRRQRALDFKRKFVTLKNREDNCKRCEMLFEYAGKGNGEWCDECLNELGIL